MTENNLFVLVPTADGGSEGCGTKERRAGTTNGAGCNVISLFLSLSLSSSHSLISSKGTHYLLPSKS
jgi:hypothetical protein